jgi:hypothetical protein
MKDKVSKIRIPWWRIARASLFGLVLAVRSAILFIFGRPKLLKKYMMAIGLIGPTTAEEWNKRILFLLLWKSRFMGFSIPEVFHYVIARKFGKEPMTDFVKGLVGEVTTDMGTDFFLRAAQMDDRSLAIVTTSLLEHYLGFAVMTRFGKLIQKEDYLRVFGPNAPLSALSAKINLCHSLGILVGDMRHDLTIMRKIRNDFAHGIKTLSFSDRQISDRCKSLKMKIELNEDVSRAARTEERQKFIGSAQVCLISLAVILARNVHSLAVTIEQAEEINRRTQEMMDKAKSSAVTSGAVPPT